MSENLARALAAEKLEKLRYYKCTKSNCIMTEKAGKE